MPRTPTKLVWRLARNTGILYLYIFICEYFDRLFAKLTNDAGLLTSLLTHESLLAIGLDIVGVNFLRNCCY